MAPPFQLSIKTRASPHRPFPRVHLLLGLVFLLTVIAIVGAAQDEQADNGAEWSEAELLLPLPPEDDKALPHEQQQQWRLGETLSLDELGPIIINQDGTTRRIANWPQLTKYEQERTLVRIAKRNQERLAALNRGAGDGTREEELQTWS